MKLINIIKSADPETEILDIIFDTRKAKENTLFICIKGSEFDSHDHAIDAYNKGCRIFTAEHEVDVPSDAKVFITKDTRRFAAVACAEFFGCPAKKLFVVALTGTKGKTSITFMLRSILEKAGIKTGIIGTTGIIYDDVFIHSDNSTPPPYIIHYQLSEMVKKGCKAVIIEATSQGFMQKRTYGMTFDIGVFTNISPDHIGPNEHKDFNDYFNCKMQIFNQSKFAVINGNTDHLKEVMDFVRCPYTLYGFENRFDTGCESIDFFVEGGEMKTFFVSGGIKYESGIPGRFSVSNALCAIAVAKRMSIPIEAIQEGLKNANVRGRMETVYSRNFTVMIDYAHNELSVAGLFEAVREYNPKRIITVFGCGGNRSKLRRYDMGELIAKNSDFFIITSDNPRDEEVKDINNDILVGVKKAGEKSDYIIIEDRKEAINFAIKNAIKGDIILVIGKGHQDYEEIKGKKYPFDERQIILDAVKTID